MQSGSHDTLQKESFVQLWALAHYVHYQWGYLFLYWTQQEFSYSLLYSIVLALLINVAVIFCILRPASSTALASLGVLQLMEVFHQSPAIPNHWLLVSFVHIAILFCMLKQRDSWWPLFKENIRYGLPCFYFFAAFWKSNTGFLNPEISCTNIFAQELINIAPLKSFLPSLTLLVEAGIAILLCFSRTRNFSIILAFAFHLSLSMHIQRFFVNFSSVMIALLYVAYNREAKKKFIGKHDTLILIILYSFPALQALDLLSIKGWMFSRFLVWIVYFFFLSRYMLRQSSTFKPYSFGAKSYLLSILVFLNGITPILGLKTHSAWQMYGNLSISHESSNHLLLPRSFDVLGLMENPESIKERSYLERKLYRVQAHQSDECRW